MAHIKTIDYPDAQGRLRQIYDAIIAKRGKLAEVHKVQSLNPETIIHHMELYMGIMYSQSPLTRAEREMMGVVVSAANGCAYCTTHHQKALNAYWRDDERVRMVAINYKDVNLSPKEHAMCSFAHKLTISPHDYNDTDSTEVLRKATLDDRDILDATLVVGYFNFVNRLVLALGVELENDQGTGYKF